MRFWASITAGAVFIAVNFTCCVFAQGLYLPNQVVEDLASGAAIQSGGWFRAEHEKEPITLVTSASAVTQPSPAEGTIRGEEATHATAIRDGV